ncbi:MAG: T9SS type A sorting domain-containing protein [Flavobacteriaceae bacterium]
MKKKLLIIALFCFALMQAQDTPLVGINIPDAQMVCNPGDCTVLNVVNQYMPKSTDSYTVQGINYNPLFPFTGGTVLDNSNDDVWSQLVNLPFNFCFYGNSYNRLIVGSNGVVSFNTTVTGDCPWEFTQTIPNASFPIRNAIYGVYQDTNIQSPPVTNSLVQNVNYYIVDTGIYTAPNRAFVVNFNELPLYNCGGSLGYQTSQIVIHEGTNIIEVFVKSRTSCSSWNNGSGLIGVQNQSGTSAITPSTRNTGTWSATNEAWRFTPNGISLPITYQWFIDDFLVPGANSDSFVVCPTDNQTAYRVQASFENCGSSFVLSNQYGYDLLATYPLLEPTNLSVCSNDTGMYTVNIDQSAYVLNGANPAEYDFKYYDNLTDAENVTNNFISNIFNYSFTQNQTLYLVIESNISVSGCHWARPFALNINPPVSPPTGDANQTYNPGQTLNDLMVQGQNIQWYDSAVGGNLLSGTTVLQNDTTYYASQTVNNCESRMSNPVRLAVHVYDATMSNQGFAKSDFKVYPNPTHQFLNISNLEEIKEVILSNSLGQKVLEFYPNQVEYIVNMTQLSAGVYMLNLKTETQSQTLKVVKN